MDGKTQKSIDNSPREVVGKNQQITIDKTSGIVLSHPDLQKIKDARRWLLGASRLLDEAANGHELTQRISAEAAVLVNMADIAIFDLTTPPGAK
jgi:hypothetical protein